MNKNCTFIDHGSLSEVDFGVHESVEDRDNDHNYEKSNSNHVLLLHVIFLAFGSVSPSSSLLGSLSSV
jgi:hypothetical protein